MAKVVIADDSPTLRRIVSSVLTRAGHEVVATEDGVAGVQAVFAHQPDVVVLDVQMPRVSGFVAARLLKDDWRTAEIPVVMLTSLDAASDRYWADQAGAERYLTKDFEAPELVTAVEELLGRRDPLLTPDPVALDDADVMAMVCDLLDRKLFESSVQQGVLAVASRQGGLEGAVADLLGLVQRFVGYDLGAVLLGDERTAYVAVGAPTAHVHYDDFVRQSAASLASHSGRDLSPGDVQVRLAAAGGEIVPDPEDLPGGPASAAMSTFVSMPLRGHGGVVVGVLAISSARSNAFGETALSTLSLIEGPAAIVIDNARLSARGVVPAQTAR